MAGCSEQSADIDTRTDRQTDTHIYIHTYIHTHTHTHTHTNTLGEQCAVCNDQSAAQAQRISSASPSNQRLGLDESQGSVPKGQPKRGEHITQYICYICIHTCECMCVCAYARKEYTLPTDTRL